MITQRLPYPGLRPFERSDSDIFFGREDQSDELLRRLAKERFLAVVGPSGCGKSSLVRAGMIAGLETGYMAQAGSRWRVAIMRPGASPFCNLATKLLDRAALGPEREGHENAAAPFLEATLRRGPLGIVEALRETPLPPSTNLLLVVDQFEELIRFKAAAKHDEADAFVALLLESAAQREFPIYVVLTMRSDYIGDCAVFTGLPEALNRGQYLTPRLTREQRQSAIVGPARVFEGDVEPQLVNRILNEMGPEPDQLPVLQHLLMRMWTYGRPGTSDSRGRGGGARARATEEVSNMGATRQQTLASPTRSAAAVLHEASGAEGVHGRVLTTADYEAVGGFANALSKHANEVFDTLDEKQQQTATLLFRRLCERGSRRRDVRRPAPVCEIMDLAHLSLDEVTAVADAFRSPDHNFLTPAFPEPLAPETVLDITHESLIRQWDRLNKWAELERESARQYRFLEESARLWKEGRAALWGTPNLEEALSWHQREVPTAEWAKRYGGDFTLAEEFLEASRKKRISDEAREKAQQERRLKRAHHLAASLALIVAMLVAGILTYCYLYVWEYKVDYKGFVKVYGEPKGVGQLTSQQVRHRAVSARIIRKGRLGRVTEMQVVNSRGDLTPLHDIGTYLQPAEEQSPLRECDWKFSYDSAGRIANEIAYNRLGKMVWGFVYSPSQDKNMNTRDAYYLGPDGYPRQERGSAASFVHLEYGNDGYEHRILYRDRLMKPMPGPDKAFGQERTYDDQGRVIEIKSLDPDGKPMNDEAGNSSLRMIYDASGNVLTSNAYDATGLPTVVTEGWSQRRFKYDENGNDIETAYFDEAGRPALHKDGYHRQTNIFDERGNSVEERFWGTLGEAAVLSDGYHAVRVAYNDLGYAMQITYLDSSEQPTPERSGVVTEKLRYENGREVERAFFDANGNPVVSNKGYHKVMSKYDDRGNRIEVAYLESDGKPTTSEEGYASFTSQYNANNQLVRQDHYDVRGQPSTGKNTYASLTFTYDDRGNRTEESYFDITGRRTDGGDGFAIWKATYDAKGNAVRTEYFGTNGNAVLNKEGYAGFTSEFDHLGKETRIAYFGLHNEPVRNDEGVAGWTSVYDAVGNEIRREYFDPTGRPAALSKARYASYEATFDRSRHRTELRFFDVKHKPVLSDEGYALERIKYDARGQITELEYLDGKEKLVLAGGEKEYARAVHRYDEHGNTIESGFFGINNEKVLLKLGYHSVQRTYDNHNHPLDVRFYGLHGELVETSEGYARVQKHFDKYGNVIDESSFSRLDTPVAVDGCYQNVNRYDERQRRIEERCVGVDGKQLVSRGDGSAVRKFQYDQRSNQTEVAYFGTRNEPVRWYGKFQHKAKHAYDNRDHEIEETYFDTDGQRMIGVHKTAAGYELCRRWTGHYDQIGLLVGEQCSQ